MSDREQELAEKYDLVPIYMEDKVDGSDVVAVDWVPVVAVLDRLTDELDTLRAAAERENDAPTYRFDIEVMHLNHYGDKVESRTPASILAKDKAEVTEKVRTAFNATYDDFRKFWSHKWRLNSVTEVRLPALDTGTGLSSK